MSIVQNVLTVAVVVIWISALGYGMAAAMTADRGLFFVMDWSESFDDSNILVRFGVMWLAVLSVVLPVVLGTLLAVGSAAVTIAWIQSW